MSGISHHLLLCATASKAKCCDPTVGAASWDRLKQLVKQLGLEDPGRAAGIVLRSKADCLRICEPIEEWLIQRTPMRCNQATAN